MTKRIAVLTHFFPPEPCAAANRASSLVKALVEEGNDVTVITNFASFPGGRVAAGDGSLWRVEELHGARVIRLFTRTFAGFPGARLLHWSLSCAAATIALFVARRRFDVLLVTLPPITLALPALIGAGRHRAKLIVDVRDVFPDIAIAMGEWRANGFLARATERVARRLYRRADMITAVTQTALDQIASRGVAPGKMLLAPNGCDSISSAVERSERKDGRFVALYAGNLGLASDVDVLLDAAALLRDDQRISMWIAGDGVEGERVRRRVADEHLSNVRLWGAVSRERAIQMMADADVSLVPLRAGIGESIPTKIFDALSVGCPVIVAADGEARNAALASGGGVAVPPGDAGALAGALSRFSALESSELRTQGTTGRSFVLNHYQRDRIMLDYSRRISAL